MTELTFAPQQAASAAPVTAAPYSRSRAPVLIVDPNPAVRRIISLMLQGEGWPALQAADADGGFELLELHAPALVLFDVTPQGPNALEFTRRVREASARPARIAFMSVYPKPPGAIADYFLPKPLDFDAILALLSAIEQEDAATLGPGYTR